MIKSVGFISSKGLNPYAANWNGGDKKAEEKSEAAVTKPESTVTVKEEPLKADVVQVSNSHKNVNNKLSVGALVAAGASAVISTVGIVAGRKNARALEKNAKLAEQSAAEIKELIKNLETTSQESIQTVKNDANKNVVAALTAALGLAAGGAAGSTLSKHTRDDLKEKGFDEADLGNLQIAGAKLDTKFQEIDSVKNTADLALSKASSGENVRDGRTQEMRMHSGNYHGLKLLTYCDEDKVVNKTKNDLAYKEIRSAAEFYMNRDAASAMNDVKKFRSDYSKYLSPNTIWSVTAEYEPIKSGGLGVVPKELQDNFTKLGLDNPTFIPMYLSPGKGELKQVFNPQRPNDYTYYYKNNAFNVTKFATMPIKKYSGTIPSTQNIEFFVGYVGDKEQKDGKLRPIVFVNDNETFSTDLYNNGMQGHEKMKFAVLDKAVYQLAKQKISEAVNETDAKEGKPANYNTGCSEIVINDKEAYDRIKAPVSMILNDWHAAAISGMMRYKAPLENAHNEISDTASNIMKKMPLIMIGHNAGIPGATTGDDALTENVINTLYDGYAYGVTENAASGYYNRVEGDEAYNSMKINEDNIGNSIFFNRNTNREFNSLAHGICLSDWYVPVSKNYSEELMSGVQDSGTAAGLIEKRARAGEKVSTPETLKKSTVLGIVNGLDTAGNNIQAKAGFIKKMTGEDVAMYNPSDSVETIKDARTKNKMIFGEKFILPELMSDKQLQKNSLLNGNDKDKDVKIAQLDKEMAEISDKFHSEFNADIPIISFAHRLTSQKGLPILTGAVKKLYNNWDKEFAGKERPFIVMGGPPDDPSQVSYMREMKDSKNFNESAQKDMWKIVTKPSNMPNPLVYAGSTFFCGPSTFEPCGLIQGESFAMGTPVITTRTGGYVDTVVDANDKAQIANGKKPNGFVANYDSIETVRKSTKDGEDAYQVWLDKAVDNYYDKMVEALKFYYEKPAEYNQMIKDNLNVNFSWSQGKSDDSIHQYLDKLGISDADLAQYKA